MTNLRTAIGINSLKRRPRAKRRHEEGDFQTTAIEHLELVLPAQALCFSIDHANARNRIAGALRKRRGVIRGIPDIYVYWSEGPGVPGITWGVTFWAECKATDGRLTDDQEAFRDAALAVGQHWCAPRTLTELDAALRLTPIPCRRVAFMSAGATFVGAQ